MQVDDCQKFNVAIKRDLRHNDKFDELLNVQTLEKQTEQKVNTILSLSITVLILRSEEDFSLNVSLVILSQWKFNPWQPL